jgi:superfamily I DNA/RNA helicase
MQAHRVERAKDKGFWSVRVGSDLRIIYHQAPGSVTLCYVDHHDEAYAWAMRRKLESHPTTGAMQFVEIRETVREITVPVYVNAPAAKAAAPRAKTPRLLFAAMADETLLGYGVPPEWVPDVRAATEETLLALTDHLPAEAAEALLEVATGGKPRLPQPATPALDPFDHPDAQRRFRLMTTSAELAQALDYPWEKWMVFLHPEQRQLVDKEFTGPARVSGSAGTGKTIVALHRAVHLARTYPGARVLLTTFSGTLANALRARLRQLTAGEPQLGERIDVHAINSQTGQVRLAPHETIVDLLREAAGAVESHRFTAHFLQMEWEQIVDAWQLTSWEAYRDVARLGRKTRLPEPQRRLLWSIFAQVQAGLAERGLVTHAGLFTRLANAFANGAPRPFDFVVVDEAQDLTVAHLRFFAAVGAHRPDALFFAGDLGQRIFQQPFSWKALGVDIRGRARTLKVNYRTSHQIRMQADRLLGPEVTDLDGNTESRAHTVSVFNGPPPTIQVAPSEREEIAFAGAWLAQRIREGIAPQECALFVRSAAELGRARAAAGQAGLPYKVLDETVETTGGHLSISTMHLAKGLEFRAVAIMACDDEVIPLQERIEAIGDDADLAEVYATERQLLYVACTRARDHLLLTAVAPASEFLEDLQTG